jgi:hypothetical protein
MKRPVFVTAAVSVAAVFSGLALMTTSFVAASSLPTLTLAVTKINVVVGGSKVSGAVNIVSTLTGEANDSPALVLLAPRVTPKVAVESHLVDQRRLARCNRSLRDDRVRWLHQRRDSDHGPGGSPAWPLRRGRQRQRLHRFTVTKCANPARLPTPGGTVKAIDFAFRGSSTLSDGELVRFSNDGYLIHMLAYAQTKDMADAKQAEADLLAGTINKQKTQELGTGVKSTAPSLSAPRHASRGAAR